MTQISEQALQAAVREYRDPYLEKDLYDLGAVKSLAADEAGKVTLMVELPYPSKGIAGGLKQLVANALENVDGVETVDVHVAQKLHSYKVQKDLPSVPGVKNIIAVASGKAVSENPQLPSTLPSLCKQKAPALAYSTPTSTARASV